MTIYNPCLIHSVKASSDIEEHRFIGFDGNYCTEGAKALGVSDVSVESGEYVPVGVFGILVVLSDGTITSGSAVTSSDEGKAIAADDTSEINGYALEDVSEGEEVRIIRGI